MVHSNKGFDRVVSASTGIDPVTLLATEVQKVLESEELSISDWSVVRVQVKLNPVDSLQWLKVQSSPRKMYWKGRDGHESTAGVGCADEIAHTGLPLTNLKKIGSYLLNAGQAKYFGGIRFDPRQEPSNEWMSFGGYKFYLPRFELISTEASTTLVCNLILPRDKRGKWAILKEVSEIKLPPHNLFGDAILPLTRIDEPVEEFWHQAIAKLLKEIKRESGLEKVVIARKVTFQFSDKVDRLALFKRLSDITPQHFHFYFQFDSEYAFMGASPERLYKRDGRYVESEAIAGTGYRSLDGKDDSLYADALLSSEKDQREHGFVRNSILKAMEDLCSTMKIDPKPSLLDLNMGRHLKSKFWGILRNESSDIDILSNIHPTSAVGGYPTEAALDSIQEVEPFDRGWYSGPVGWIGKNASEFAVAIRSALSSKESISLFSGAGIVEGSTPKGEWLEVEQKISDFIKVLGLDQRSVKY